MISFEEAYRRYFIGKHGIFRIDIDRMKIHMFTKVDLPQSDRDRIRNITFKYFSRPSLFEFYIIGNAFSPGSLFLKMYKDDTLQKKIIDYTEIHGLNGEITYL